MHTLERIRYEPRSVREILVEMKNLSEFMIDLAYSAALFNDKELAEEVVRLERRVDSLSYLLDMIAMVAVRGPKDAESLVGVAVVASATDKISDAAADIAAIVTRDIGVHPIVREVLEKVEERIGRLKVEANSILARKKLDELKEEARIGIDVVAISRKDEWIIDPKPEETVEEDDILIVRGSPGGVAKLGQLAEGYSRRARYEIETHPFKEIIDRLVELKDTSELMIDLAYSSLLLNNRELAEEVQALEDHMDNSHTEFELLVLDSISCREESRDYLGLIRLGVVTEKIADAAARIAAVVLRGLEPHPVLKLVIREAAETVISVRVSENSRLVGKTLREAQIPEVTGMWILVVKRDKEWLRPKTDLVIKAGDVLVASGYAEGSEGLKKIAAA